MSERLIILVTCNENWDHSTEVATEEAAKAWILHHSIHHDHTEFRIWYHTDDARVIVQHPVVQMKTASVEW